MLSIQVNSKRKACRIIEELKKQSRIAFYDTFYSLDGKFYIVFYN